VVLITRNLVYFFSKLFNFCLNQKLYFLSIKYIIKIINNIIDQKYHSLNHNKIDSIIINNKTIKENNHQSIIQNKNIEIKTKENFKLIKGNHSIQNQKIIINIWKSTPKIVEIIIIFSLCSIK